MPELDSLLDVPKPTFAGLDLLTVEDVPPWLNLMLYGDPGAGKTVLAGSADEVADMSPVLLIDIEGGAFSLKAFYPGVHVIRVRSLDQLVTIYKELEKGEHPYRTVIVDSLSETAKMIMNNIMAAVVAEDSDRDPDVPSLREWGKLGEQMRRMVRRFRDLPMHTIFTALLDETQDQKGRVRKYPMLGGKLKREVSGFMDIVLFVYTKHVKINAAGELDKDADESLHRFVLSSSTDEYVCKDRSNRMPEILLDPTMTKIHELIQGE